MLSLQMFRGVLGLGREFTAFANVAVSTMFFSSAKRVLRCTDRFMVSTSRGSLPAPIRAQLQEYRLLANASPVLRIGRQSGAGNAVSYGRCRGLVTSNSDKDGKSLADKRSQLAKSPGSVNRNVTTGSSRLQTVESFLGHRGWKYDVFLCHTGDDKPFVRLLYEEMKKEGLLPFFDEITLLGQGGIGQKIVAKALLQSPIFVAILSPHFGGEEYPEAEAEVATALATGKDYEIVPLFYKTTAKECRQSTINVVRDISRYNGYEQKETKDRQFASDVTYHIKRLAQAHVGSYKLHRAESFIDDLETDDLTVFQDLRDELLSMSQRQKHYEDERRGLATVNDDGDDKSLPGKKQNVTANWLSPFGWKYDVFLCHTDHDKPFVRMLHDELRKRGVCSFYNKEIMPQEGGQARARILKLIGKATIQSAIFAVILSHQFKGEKNPEDETSVALVLGKNYQTVPIFYNMTVLESGRCTIDVIRRLSGSSYYLSGYERKDMEERQFAYQVAESLEGLVHKHSDCYDLKVLESFIDDLNVWDTEILGKLKDKIEEQRKQSDQEKTKTFNSLADGVAEADVQLLWILANTKSEGRHQSQGALHLMGLRHMDFNQLEETEKMFLRYLEQNRFSEEDVLAAMSNVASTYAEWGEIAVAIEKYENIIQKMKKMESTVGKMDLSATHGNLGCCYQQSGQLDQAFDSYKDALTICEKELQLSHPLRAFAMRRLAGCIRAQEKLEQARSLAKDALGVANTVLPADHPDLGWYLATVAECHRRLGDIDESIKLYESAIDIFRHHLFSQADGMAVVKHNVALAYNNRGDRDTATKLTKESIELKKQHLSEGHPKIAKSMVELGAILCEKGDFAEAVVHLRSGMEILSKTLPAGPFAANGLYWRGVVAMKLKQLPEAQQYLTECLRLLRNIYPRGHSYIASAKSLLQEVTNSISDMQP